MSFKIHFLHSHFHMYKHIVICIAFTSVIYLLYKLIRHTGFTWLFNAISIIISIHIFASRAKTSNINAMLKSQIVRLKNNCSKLRPKITRTQSRNRRMRALIRAKCTSSSKMATELNNQTMEMSILAEKNMQKDNEIDELNTEIETLNDTVNSLQAMLEEQQMEATRLQTVLDQCRTENTRLETESQRCLEMLGSATTLNSSLTQNNSCLSEEKTQLQNEVSRLRSKIKGLQKESEKIQAENKDQHNLVMAILPELNRKNSELSALEDKHQRLLARHSRLQQALRDATSNQSVLDMVSTDNEKYLTENETIQRFISESIDRYNKKLDAYQVEEDRIVSAIQTCC